jgi:YegS/Rv2252/BmrU family lipid kinase
LTTPKRLLLIFNPLSGAKKLSVQLFDVVNKFTSCGFIVTVYPTQAQGEVGAVIARFADSHDYFVCAGGDGTVAEAINALMLLEKRPAFGVIPSGTVNDFAASINIPNNIQEAVDIIINETPMTVDVGQFGDKHFAYVAAFGMYTDVSYATPQHTKNLLGKFAYFLEGAKRFGKIPSSPCRFVMDGEIIEGDFSLGIIANAHFVAGVKLPSMLGTDMSDGLFDVILIRTPATLKEQQEIISSLLTHEVKSNLFVIRKAREIAFTSATPVPWTLDGDYGGEYDAIGINNLHHAIEVIMPPMSLASDDNFWVPPLAP